MRRREFSKATRREAYRRSGGRCENPGCGVWFKRPQYDHIKPCAFDGDATVDNIQVLCEECHKRKTGEQDAPAIAKSNRILDRQAGIRPDRTIRTIRAWRGFSSEVVLAPRKR